MWIQPDMKSNSIVKLYMLDLKQEGTIVIGNYDGSQIEEEATFVVDQLTDEVKYLHVTHLPHKKETLLTVMSVSGSWAIYNSFFEVVISSKFLLQYLTLTSSLSAHHIRVGYEGIYIKLKRN